MGDGELKEAVADSGPLIHLAEIGCLQLLSLFDDMAVRDAAKQLDLIPVGSLGVVVKAYEQGQISLEDAEYYIGNLYSVSSLFVTRAIADLAIEKLRATAKK